MALAAAAMQAMLAPHGAHPPRNPRRRRAAGARPASPQPGARSAVRADAARAGRSACSISPRSAPSDYLIDLGCGDGRIAVAAAQRGARALGVDLDPLRIEEAAAAARIAGVEARVRFRRQDLFRTPIYDASVVALYLLPRDQPARCARACSPSCGPAAASSATPSTWATGGPRPRRAHRRPPHLPVDRARGRRRPLGADRRRRRRFVLEIEQRFQEVTGTLTGAAGCVELEGRAAGHARSASPPAGEAMARHGRATRRSPARAAGARSQDRLDRRAPGLSARNWLSASIRVPR